MTTTAANTSPSPTQRMHCMEVWGGSRGVETSVVMAGLDAWVYSRPYGESASGGDIHYVSSCATGRITRLLVADVSGHGQPVARMAEELRVLMGRYVNYLDQTEFVREMNQRFAALAEIGCFATAVVMTFFGPNRHLSLCNAGHPPPLLYRKRTGRWSYLQRSAQPQPAGAERRSLANMPLGVEDLSSYEQFGVRLSVGDLVVCYTDALLEASNKDGRLLGQQGLLDVIRTLEFDDPASLVRALLKAIAVKHAGNLNEDDVTVLMFRPNGQTPRGRARDRWLAPFRMMRGWVASLLPGGPPMARTEWNLASIGGYFFDSLNQRWRREDPSTQDDTDDS